MDSLKKLQQLVEEGDTFETHLTDSKILHLYNDSGHYIAINYDQSEESFRIDGIKSPGEYFSHCCRSAEDARDWITAIDA